MAKIKATIGGVAYEINAVKGITANNTEINVPLTIEGEGGGGGGFTEYNEVQVAGSDMTMEALPIAPSNFTGIKVTHGLTQAPTLIIISTNAATDGSVKGMIIGGIFYTDGQEGYIATGNIRKLSAYFTTNVSTGVANAAMAQYGTASNPGTGWGMFGVDETYFYLNKSATNQAFGTSLTYTFKFFA